MRDKRVVIEDGAAIPVGQYGVYGAAANWEIPQTGFTDGLHKYNSLSVINIADTNTIIPEKCIGITFYMIHILLDDPAIYANGETIGMSVASYWDEAGTILADKAVIEMSRSLYNENGQGTSIAFHLFCPITGYGNDGEGITGSYDSPQFTIRIDQTPDDALFRHGHLTVTKIYLPSDDHKYAN